MKALLRACANFYTWAVTAALFAATVAACQLTVCSPVEPAEVEARNAEPAPTAVPGPLWEDDEPVIDAATREPAGTWAEVRRTRRVD